MSTFQVVLVPTILGVACNELFPSVVKHFTRVLPLVGVVLTTLLCASPVGQVSEVLKCASSILDSENFHISILIINRRAPCCAPPPVGQASEILKCVFRCCIPGLSQESM